MENPFIYLLMDLNKLEADQVVAILVAKVNLVHIGAMLPLKGLVTTCILGD